MLRKILDRVGFEHQVGMYPYENDRSAPPGLNAGLKRSRSDLVFKQPRLHNNFIFGMLFCLFAISLFSLVVCKVRASLMIPTRPKWSFFVKSQKVILKFCFVR